MSDVADTLTPPGLPLRDSPRIAVEIPLNDPVFESTRQLLGTSTGSAAIFQELCKETIGSCWKAV